MKTRLYIIFALVLSLFFAACKDDSNPTDPDPGNGDNENYLPTGIGSYYKFNLVTTDSTGATVNGQRSFTYTATVNLGGTDYIEQTDSLMISSGSTTSKSYLRKTSSGAFYFLDTTGLGNTIPDSLLQYITFDPELRFLTFPLTVNSTWPVFKMTLKYLINLDVVEVTAQVVGTENITLNLASGNQNVSALKIKYTLLLRIPDPENPFSIINQSYEAHSWVVKDIGVARMQGNATILGAFSGGNIDFDDSTRTVTQELVQYSVK